jgi:hypothetical protein
MPATTRFEVDGAAKALKILGNLDREVAKEVRAELRAAAKPVITDAYRLTPIRPLRNWGSWTTPNGRDLSWDRRKVQAGMKLVQRTSGEKVGSFFDHTGTKRNRYTKTIAFLEVRNTSAVGHIFELAGASQPGSQFNRAIQGRYGPPKRLLYKAFDYHAPRVERDVRATLDRLEREVTRRLAA